MPTIDNVPLDIAVVLGTTSMPVHQVLRLGRGAIIELDSSEDDEVTILANNMPVAIMAPSPPLTSALCFLRLIGDGRAPTLRYFWPKRLRA